MEEQTSPVVDETVASTTSEVQADKEQPIETQPNTKEDEGTPSSPTMANEALNQDKEELEKQRLAIEEREKALRQKELAFDAARMLEQIGLSTQLVPYLVGESNELTAQRIEVFKPIFDEAVQQVVAERLKGTTPTLGTSPSVKNGNAEITQMIQNTINGGNQ